MAERLVGSSAPNSPVQDRWIQVSGRKFRIDNYGNRVGVSCTSKCEQVNKSNLMPAHENDVVSVRPLCKLFDHRYPGTYPCLMPNGVVQEWFGRHGEAIGDNLANREVLESLTQIKDARETTSND